jgi:aspartate/methionine/tyrosine aminotransferase
MPKLRAEIETLEQNGITRVALQRIGDPDVIPLWFGEGDLVTPAFIRSAATAALEQGYTFYGHTRGRPELRAAIKAYLDRIYGTDLDFERITVPGASMLAITMAAQMTLTRGDHALIVSPHWPNIDRAFQVTGARFDCVRQRWSADGGWTLALADVRAAARPDTRALFLNSPCNPTGWVMSPEGQRELLGFCRERGIYIIADEVYHRTVYAGEVAPSFLTCAEEDDPIIVVNGFSKAYAMTGWRLGWMITPRRLASQMAVLSECFATSAPSFIQRAGVVALAEGEAFIASLREQYLRGRDAVMAILAAHPRVELAPPEGAFYAFPRIIGMRSSLDFVEGVLAEENVGLAPGYTFGPGNDDRFRLCFAQSTERLEEALRRIVRYLDRHERDFA